MCEVPHLAEAITPDSWEVLLACSRHWRQLLHDHAESIFVSNISDVSLLAEGV